MARTKTKQEEVEQPIVMEGQNEAPEVTETSTEEKDTQASETPIEEVVPENTIEAPEVEVNEVKVKKVKIHTLEEIDCIVAGNHISLRKDKDVEVSADVAAILCYSKKAYRL